MCGIIARAACILTRTLRGTVKLRNKQGLIQSGSNPLKFLFPLWVLCVVDSSDALNTFILSMARACRAAGILVATQTRWATPPLPGAAVRSVDGDPPQRELKTSRDSTRFKHL